MAIMEIQIVLPAKKAALALTVDELSSSAPRRLRLAGEAHHLVFLQTGSILAQDARRRRETFEAPVILLVSQASIGDSFLEITAATQGMILGFLPSTLETLSSLDADSAVFDALSALREEPFSVSFNEAAASSGNGKLRDICRHMAEGKPGRNALALAGILEVFVETAHAFSCTSGNSGIREKDGADGIWSIQQVMDYIESNYAEAFSLEWFVKKCAMNTSDFSRRFKESAGCPLFEFINRRRIDRACQLLKNSDLPVIDIALSTGFTNLSFFNRYFLRIMDDSPRSWRTKARRS